MHLECSNVYAHDHRLKGDKMKWLLELLGIKTSIKKKQRKLTLLREKAFQAQRNGNLSLCGKYTLAAELLETEIFEEQADKKL